MAAAAGAGVQPEARAAAGKCSGGSGGGGGVAGALREQVLAPLSMACFVGAILASALLQTVVLALLILYPGSPLSWTLLALLAGLALMPLGPRPPAWAAAFVSFASAAAADYFPARLVVEDEAALRPEQPYVIALEPHSALPTAIPVAFGSRSALLPPALAGRTHGLVSSVCFKFPLVRHLYHWWGFRPITKRAMKRLLGHGRAVVIVPGGVQECLVMEPSGVEVAFLRKRKGFIRLAMQAGADVVPAFAFGQSATYHWLRPGPPLVSRGLVKAVSRRTGMVPLVLLGRWGSPVPHRVPLTVAVGAPLRLPKMEAPPEDLVQQHLDEYIAALQGLFERHKAAAGYPDLKLRIL